MYICIYIYMYICMYMHFYILIHLFLYLYIVCSQHKCPEQTSYEAWKTAERSMHTIHSQPSDPMPGFVDSNDNCLGAPHRGHGAVIPELAAVTRSCHFSVCSFVRICSDTGCVGFRKRDVVSRCRLVSNVLSALKLLQ